MSIISYLIFSILIFLLIKNKLLDEYAAWLIPLGVMMIIRDMTPFLGTFKSVEHHIFDTRMVWQGYRSGELSGRDMSLICNRVIFFPFLLIGYISLKLLVQLDIPSFSPIISEKSWIEYGFLFLLVISGFVTLVRESLDEAYYKNEGSHVRTKLSLALTLLFSLVASVIIFRQTVSIGILSIPVSIISGLIIYLVGILLLQNE